MVYEVNTLDDLIRLHNQISVKVKS